MTNFIPQGGCKDSVHTAVVHNAGAVCCPTSGDPGTGNNNQQPSM